MPYGRGRGPVLAAARENFFEALLARHPLGDLDGPIVPGADECNEHGAGSLDEADGQCSVVNGFHGIGDSAHLAVLSCRIS